ncbi:MAG: PD40 domain-containing protein [Flavobacteriales bacterium]|nr:PD40 domain-containing protein [Flavobacteriales bacterium]
MKQFYFTILIFGSLLTFSNHAFSQDDKTGMVGYKMKMADARHQYLNGNIRGGLLVYRELLKEFTNDAMINFRMGECYFDLKEWELSVEYYQNAKNLNDKIVPELYYKLGEAYHRNNQLDKAKESLTTFQTSASKKTLKSYDVSKLLSQVDYATKMTESPVKVDIINLGKNINSRGGDYAPSISADGKTMIFTSRRSDTKGGGVDKAGDYKYFEDIYIAEWDSVNNEWGKALPIEGKLNTEGHDASLSISPDGKQIYIYRNDGSLYIGDIFVSKKRSSGTWGNPQALDKPINSSYFESSASLSADGNRLYFVSEREQKKYNPQGKGDIYVVEKISKSTWGEPFNLGSVINTPEDEISVFIHPDGKTLFFSSKGHLSMGGYDIFMSKMQEDGTWSKPENLGYPINTVDDDVHFILGTDGKIAHYSTVKKDGLGERDIYKIDMSNYDLLKGVQTNLSIIQGVVEAQLDGAKISAEITFTDASGKVIGRTITDEEGNYFITLPGNAKYDISVTADGYQPSKKNVELKLGNGKTHIENYVFQLEITPAE